jgi:hypothetical protein
MNLILMLLLASSCAVLIPKYGNMYYADTAGTYKCDATVMDMSIVNIDTFKNMNIKDFENHSGYSECKNTLSSEDTAIVECKTPTLYRRVASTKMAQCHKFLADNNIKVVK